MTELEQLEQKMTAMKAELSAAKAEQRRLARKSTRVMMSKSFADYKNEVIDKKPKGVSILSAMEYELYIKWFNRKNSLTMEEAIEIMKNPTLGRPGLLTQGVFFREIAAMKGWKKVRLLNKDTGLREWIYVIDDIAKDVVEIPEEMEEAFEL